MNNRGEHVGSSNCQRVTARWRDYDVRSSNQKQIASESVEAADDLIWIKRCRLKRAIRKLESAKRDLNDSLYRQQRRRGGRADADLAEFVFKDIGVAKHIRACAADPSPFRDAPRRP